VIAALHMAAANGHLDIVEYLISQGVVRVHRCFSFSSVWGLGVLGGGGCCGKGTQLQFLGAFVVKFFDVCS